MGQWHVCEWLEANPGLGFRHSRVLMLLSRIFRYNGVNRRKSADGRGWEWSI